MVMPCQPGQLLTITWPSGKSEMYEKFSFVYSRSNEHCHLHIGNTHLVMLGIVCEPTSNLLLLATLGTCINFCTNFVYALQLGTFYKNDCSFWVATC